MRDININSIEYNGDSVDILVMDKVPLFDLEDYDLFDQREFGQYIKNIERIIRTSFEYRQMVTYLRENMNMNKCSFYENVNNIDTFKIKIEIHHHPFTLYDIVMIVYNKRLALGELLDEEMVAKEVMFLHYNLLVGLIPLAETPHELVHNNYLFIPLDKVLGKFKDFVSIYGDYITPDLMDKLERNIDFTKSYKDSIDNAILQKKYIYIDATGSYDLPKFEEIIQLMDRRIKDIKNGVKYEPEIQQKKLFNPLISIK